MALITPTLKVPVVVFLAHINSANRGIATSKSDEDELKAAAVAAVAKIETQ